MAGSGWRGRDDHAASPGSSDTPLHRGASCARVVQGDPTPAPSHGGHGRPRHRHPSPSAPPGRAGRPLRKPRAQGRGQGRGSRGWASTPARLVSPRSRLAPVLPTRGTRPCVNANEQRARRRGGAARLPEAAPDGLAGSGTNHHPSRDKNRSHPLPQNEIKPFHFRYIPHEDIHGVEARCVPSPPGRPADLQGVTKRLSPPPLEW